MNVYALVRLYALEMDEKLPPFCRINMNGHDVEEVDEVKALILESVNACKNYKKRVPSRGSRGARESAHATRNVDFKTRDLRMWISMISAGFLARRSTLVSTRVTPEYRSSLRVLLDSLQSRPSQETYSSSLDQF